MFNMILSCEITRKKNWITHFFRKEMKCILQCYFNEKLSFGINLQLIVRILSLIIRVEEFCGCKVTLYF